MNTQTEVPRDPRLKADRRTCSLADAVVTEFVGACGIRYLGYARSRAIKHLLFHMSVFTIGPSRRHILFFHKTPSGLKTVRSVTGLFQTMSGITTVTAVRGSWYQGDDADGQGRITNAELFICAPSEESMVAASMAARLEGFVLE